MKEGAAEIGWLNGNGRISRREAPSPGSAAIALDRCGNLGSAKDETTSRGLMPSSSNPIIRVVLTVGLALASIGLYGQDVAETPHSVETLDAPSVAVTKPSHTDNQEGEQTKRILGIIPNFRAVSADVTLPPLSWKGKFIGTTQDTFDYSDFVFFGLLAGVEQAQGSIPAFHQGAAGYGRYYWHTLADQVDENYWVEFVFPATLHQDPRYYTLGHGGFLKRTAYSFSRILITRTDSGGETFNTSEVVGAGAAAGLSYLYYPSSEKTWTKTGQRWLTSVGLDAGVFIFREFWPDINRTVFHRHKRL